MDRHDAEILHYLTRDGRMSVNDLSAEAHLSQTPGSPAPEKVGRRVIKGYTALIDEKKLGFTFSVFVSVRLERQIDEELARFEAKIEALPEADCWLMIAIMIICCAWLPAILKNLKNFWLAS